MTTEPAPSAGQRCLDVRGLVVRHGAVAAVRGVSLTVESGTVVAVVGRNGAGKSSLLRGLAGLASVAGGSVQLFEDDVRGLRPHALARRGLVLVPEGRRVFGDLTVSENLRLAVVYAGRAASRQRRAVLAEVYELFPRLWERRRQRAKYLSGGEQQMLALGRAVVSRPKLILCDEPSMGLSPALAEHAFAAIRDLSARRGIAVLLAEQSVALACRVADVVHVLDRGEIGWTGTAAEVDAAPDIRALYLGK